MTDYVMTKHHCCLYCRSTRRMPDLTTNENIHRYGNPPRRKFHKKCLEIIKKTKVIFLNVERSPHLKAVEIARKHKARYDDQIKKYYVYLPNINCVKFHILMNNFYNI